MKVRSRSKDPDARNGGANCTGDAEETVVCNEGPCPGNKLV